LRKKVMRGHPDAMAVKAAIEYRGAPGHDAPRGSRERNYSG
jgi:hypothetical protein